jgi:hypothetical protein
VSRHVALWSSGKCCRCQSGSAQECVGFCYFRFLDRSRQKNWVWGGFLSGHESRKFGKKGSIIYRDIRGSSLTLASFPGHVGSIWTPHRTIGVVAAPFLSSYAFPRISGNFVWRKILRTRAREECTERTNAKRLQRLPLHRGERHR